MADTPSSPLLRACSAPADWHPDIPSCPDGGPLTAVDLVLGGGGTRFPAHLGALAALQDRGIAVRIAAGCSTGGIAAVIAKSGLDPRHVMQLLLQTDFRTLREPEPLQRIPVPGVNWLLAWQFNRGSYSLGPLRRLIDGELGKVGRRHLSDFRLVDPGRSSELPGGFRAGGREGDMNYSVVVVSADTTRHNEVFLPWDYRWMYNHDPDHELVADMLMTTAAVPEQIVPASLQSKWDGNHQVNTMRDGGVTSAFPVGILDRTDNVVPRLPTLNISLESPPPSMDQPVPQPEWSIASDIRRLVSTATTGRDSRGLVDEYRRSVFLRADFHRADDFGNDDKLRLFETGYQEMSKFLDGFSMRNYREVAAQIHPWRRHPAPTAPVTVHLSARMVTPRGRRRETGITGPGAG